MKTKRKIISKTKTVLLFQCSVKWYLHQSFEFEYQDAYRIHYSQKLLFQKMILLQTTIAKFHCEVVLCLNNSYNQKVSF